jgi:hypothetical protein
MELGVKFRAEPYVTVTFVADTWSLPACSATRRRLVGRNSKGAVSFIFEFATAQRGEAHLETWRRRLEAGRPWVPRGGRTIRE